MEKSELVFIAAPFMGHLTPSIQLAKLMLERNNQLSVSVLVMKFSVDPEGTIKVQNIISGCDHVERLRFHHLPTPENTDNWSSNKGLFFNQLIEFQKPHVREVASKIKGLCGFILDLPTSTLIDVAEEFQVPCYAFCTSGAAYFGLMLHVQSLQDDHNQDTIELFKTSEELIVPSFVQPVPISVLPTATTDKLQWSVRMRRYQYYRKPKGVIMNTFSELEDYALNSFSKDSAYGKSGLPQIYPVGPILNRSETKIKNHSQIIEWLDNQPQNSVVLVSFGSLGSFDLDQVKEIASGLEQSGHRFLWVLRQPPTEKGGSPSEYEDVELVLPKGFMDRTASNGKVVGWVPQLAVLSHPAVGGFVSHCGWNSILESIWCGVPIATWPLAAEQQLNAFQLVKELGIAVEISLDYNEAKEHQELVRAGQIGKGIRELMDGKNEMRKRVKEFSEKSRATVQENGSSHLCIEELVKLFAAAPTNGEVKARFQIAKLKRHSGR